MLSPNICFVLVLHTNVPTYMNYYWPSTWHVQLFLSSILCTRGRAICKINKTRTVMVVSLHKKRSPSSNRRLVVLHFPHDSHLAQSIVNASWALLLELVWFCCCWFWGSQTRRLATTPTAECAWTFYWRAITQITPVVSHHYRIRHQLGPPPLRALRMRTCIHGLNSPMEKNAR